MKTMKLFVLLGILHLLPFSKKMYAQEDKVSRSEWLRQMEMQEQQVTSFITVQMKNSVLKETLRERFKTSEHYKEIPKSELLRMEDSYIADHYRREYFKQHPEAIKIYNPGRVQLEPVSQEKPTGAEATNMLCNYGDFETATINNLGSQGYNGYASTYSGGVCNFVPTTSVAYSYVGFGSPDNFIVTNNVSDPYVSSLKQTNNGSKHAIRINSYTPCLPGPGINMLQKSFLSPVTGKGRINFSYALVAEHPPYDHLGANTFFLARVLDNSGNEVGSRICVPTKVPPFVNTYKKACGDRGAYVAWKDWTCAYIDFDAEAGKVYTIEFFVADCSGGAHFAYAYVDDICADVSCCPKLPPAPINLKCVPGADVSNLSWDPVPGALSYQVSITTNDPACCDPTNFGLAKVLFTNTPNVTVPRNFAACFSWSVKAIMSEECSTEFSVKECSCTPPPPGPVGLGCVPGDESSNLSWAPVPGAVSYKVSITTNDPACCPQSNFGLAKLFNTSTANISIPRTEGACFSWRVRAVLADGTETALSDRSCSCTPPAPPPVGLDCMPDPDGNGNQLYWAPVSGAVYYKVSITTNDPICCPAPNFGLSTVRNAGTPYLFVPNTLATCFSWKVQAVMPDSTTTLFSVISCSCTPSPGGGAGGFMNDQTTLGDKMAVSAVPNPASEYIYFTVSGRDKQKTSGRLSVSIYDINGKEVVRKDMNDQDQLRLDIHAFANGVYTYEIRSSKQTLFKDKVIVEK